MGDDSTSSSQAETGVTLRRGTLGLRHAIVISVTVMSPAASIFFNTSIRFFWQKRRAQFNLFRHGVVPVLGTLLILTNFLFIVIAPASPPLNLIPFILAIWVLLGVGLLFMLRRKLVEVRLDSSGDSKPQS